MAAAKQSLKFNLILVPLVLVLMVSVSFTTGNGRLDETTPYSFNLPPKFLKIQNPVDNPPTEEGVELGRKLFYDPVLSGNHKQACSGCHQQQLSFTDGVEYSIGALGKPARRNSMALINLGWQDKYFWDGRALSLEELIHFPVTDSLEMNGDFDKIQQQLNKDKNYRALFHRAFNIDTISMLYVTKAISQFLRTIVSYNTKFDLIFQDYLFNRGEIESKQKDIDDLQLLRNGFAPGNEEKYGHDTALVRQIKEISPSDHALQAFTVCLNCHYNSLQLFCIGCDGTIPPNAHVQFKNNGLETEGKDKGLYQITKKEEDKYLFKVPTLRNLIFTGPYMHDGRFKTLEEIVAHYNSGLMPNQNLDTLLMDKDKKPLRFNLSKEEEKQIVQMLKLFSDSAIINDARFSAPLSK